jgi:YebC/PmpR family DNA-binding regulatory protein
MAGHSKWANIKHKKGRADAKRGKEFSRITKEIITAVKLGGPDPKSNAKLKLVLQKAKAANVPNDNIERNIKKAANADTSGYEELSYEIYGHGGVGLIVEAMTDNKNRTASDMRIATNKKGGTIASPGSVAFNFERKGVIRIAKDQAVEEELFSAATEAGAEDFQDNEDDFEVITDPNELFTIKEAIDNLGFASKEANIEMLPKTFVDCDEKTADSNFSLIDWLEELDDVDAIYHNMQFVE